MVSDLPRFGAGDGRVAGASCAAAGQAGGPVTAGAILSQIIGRRVPHDALRLVGLNPAAGIGLGAFSF
ncbi:hypothetical protein [Nonomuraea fuscirosea]|uniref:hypothetical protein n=1 Tax=Nonomuraea fuscirosea TaxID=1291556 RepID=UPI0033F33AFE